MNALRKFQNGAGFNALMAAGRGGVARRGFKSRWPTLATHPRSTSRGVDTPRWRLNAWSASRVKPPGPVLGLARKYFPQ
jgi:hypothetical protein